MPLTSFEFLKQAEKDLQEAALRLHINSKSDAGFSTEDIDELIDCADTFGEICIRINRDLVKQDDKDKYIERRCDYCGEFFIDNTDSMLCEDCLNKS